MFEQSAQKGTRVEGWRENRRAPMVEGELKGTQGGEKPRAEGAQGREVEWELEETHGEGDLGWSGIGKGDPGWRGDGGIE